MWVVVQHEVAFQEVSVIWQTFATVNDATQWVEHQIATEVDER